MSEMKKYIMITGKHSFSDARKLVIPGDEFEANQEEFEKFFKTAERYPDRAKLASEVVVKEGGKIDEKSRPFPEGIPSKEWTKESLKGFLSANGAEFHHKTGADKLLEQAISVYMGSGE